MYDIIYEYAISYMREIITRAFLNIDTSVYKRIFLLYEYLILVFFNIN